MPSSSNQVKTPFSKIKATVILEQGCPWQSPFAAVRLTYSKELDLSQASVESPKVVSNHQLPVLQANRTTCWQAWNQHLLKLGRDHWKGRRLSVLDLGGVLKARPNLLWRSRRIHENPVTLTAPSSPQAQCCLL